MIFDKIKNKKKEVDENPSCTYSVENPRKKWLVFNCKGCDENANLANPKCKKGVLEILVEESNVGGIRLSDYLERGYEDESLEILLEMRGFLDKINELSMRTGASDNQKCGRCKFKPNKLFIHLQDSFVRGIDIFYDEMQLISRDLIKADLNGDGCDECIRKTKDDIVYLFNEAETLRAIIFRYGYRILI